jgi:hypothetical protein
MLLLFCRRPASIALLALSASLLGVAALPAIAEQPVHSLALMPFTYVDTSGEPRDQTVDHEARLRRMSTEIGAELDNGRIYRVVPVPPELERCDATDSDCILAASRRAGVDRLLVGTLQKVSTMATQGWVGLFDASTGRRLFYRQLTFRGDNDQAWERAASYLSKEIRSSPSESR